MDFPYPLALTWLLYLWLFGWLTLPFSKRIFSNLPDGGLAAGRVLGIALLSLLVFWLASFHWLSLHFVPLWFLGAPLFCISVTLLRRGLRHDFFVWLKEHKRTLLFSDCVFVTVWALFLWIRARNPAISTMEKPMDAALIGALARAQFLPFDNPWMSGTPFTNYYYFGHLMGASLARTLLTPNYLAYNLVQPAFCAFFVSALWSLCCAVTGSTWRGLGAAALVALLGHFEPVRQIAETHTWWPLDWWKTSRVIPNTINEYPLFTMAVGDAHAHFFALALSATFFALCYALFDDRDDEPSGGKERLFRHRYLVLACLSALLGAIWLTNTWDVPLYALLALACAFWTLPKVSFGEIIWGFAPLLARLLALPFTRLSQPNIHGTPLDFWLPPPASFFLLWGGVLLLVALAFGQWEKEWKSNRFSIALAAVGMFALIAPFCFYIGGAFGDGDLRHQDTVFKFGLQAWLLLGTAGACGALNRRCLWPKAVRLTSLVFLIVPALCTACVIRQWAFTYAPREIDGTTVLSLNGARNLPTADQEALAWLLRNAQPGDTVLEAASDKAYSAFARVSTLTGVPTPLGWIQHIEGWGADVGAIALRRQAIEQVYAWRNDDEALAALKALGVRYVFVGDLERQTYDLAALGRLRARLGTAYENGDTFIAKVP